MVQTGHMVSCRLELLAVLAGNCSMPCAGTLWDSVHCSMISFLSVLSPYSFTPLCNTRLEVSGVPGRAPNVYPWSARCSDGVPALITHSVPAGLDRWKNISHALSSLSQRRFDSKRLDLARLVKCDNAIHLASGSLPGCGRRAGLLAGEVVASIYGIRLAQSIAWVEWREGSRSFLLNSRCLLCPIELYRPATVTGHTGSLNH